MPSSVSLEPNLGLDFNGSLEDIENHTIPSSATSATSNSSRGSSLEKAPRINNSTEKSQNDNNKISDKVEEELSRLWDSGQEWILIFDNLLKHPGGKVSKGCKCDMCEMQKLQNFVTNSNTLANSRTLEKSRSGATSPSSDFAGKRNNIIFNFVKICNCSHRDTVNRVWTNCTWTKAEETLCKIIW